MAQSIEGGVVVVNTLSTKNNGAYPLVMAESVQMAEGKSVEEKIGEIDLSGYALKAEIPTTVSQLTNDSGYLTEVPNEYVTDTELTEKGYQTASQVETAITEKGYQTSAQVQTAISEATADILTKVDIDQGAENAGRILGINNEGNVEPVDAPLDNQAILEKSIENYYALRRTGKVYQTKLWKIVDNPTSEGVKQ